MAILLKYRAALPVRVSTVMEAIAADPRKSDSVRKSAESSRVYYLGTEYDRDFGGALRHDASIQTLLRIRPRDSEKWEDRCIRVRDSYLREFADLRPDIPLPRKTLLLEPNGIVDYYPNFLPDHETLFEELKNLPLRAEVLKMGAIEALTPRLTGWFGDPGTSYTYSGRKFDPSPWPEALTPLRAKLEEVGEFNSVLANFYRNGNDSVGWHADDEKELGVPGRLVIASVSLGSPRRFVLKSKETGEKHEFLLGNGDLLVMKGEIQKAWVHTVPKTAKPVGPRMNLTFRRIYPPHPELAKFGILEGYGVDYEE